jgi:extracellular elastinolytic metalloproteinase
MENRQMADKRAHRASVVGRALVCGIAASILWWTPVQGQLPQPKPAIPADSNFDARIEANKGWKVQPAPSQSITARTQDGPAFSAALTFDEQFGVTRTLTNPQGYLTAADRGRGPREIALDYVYASAGLLGLETADLSGLEITDIVPNLATGSTHVYLRQTWQGIPVFNGQLQINVNRDGRILSVNNAFVPMLSSSVNLTSPGVAAAVAVYRAATHLKLPLAAPPRALKASPGITQETTLAHGGISSAPIDAQLMLLPIRRGTVRLVWNFQIHTLDSNHAFDFTVDADSGEVWTKFDWMTSSQYNVYGRPVESPNHTAPVPPADGRTLQVNPEDIVASPYGWHDVNGAAGAEFTITRGNNVHAYEDSNNDGLPPVTDVDCGPSLLCNFPINLLGPPSGYVPAAVANLFYWTNIVHDVQYQYGFTEPAGNFQVNNYARGGLGNDDLRAEALDGGGTNNANMFTPPDGQRPRMQMYVWTAANPMRTSDLDSSVIVHEYGHGISNRLVGGPSNVGCLSNPQQPGEGLSDWWALVYTARPTDTGPMGRGMGTYVVNQATTGPGIRAQRYSTDPAINTWTYESINGAVIPHGVGSVWTQAAWEMYWALTNKYGFDPNLYTVGGAGNQRAMLYVNEGLMNTKCSPTFMDVRDGIIQAAIDNYGGQDVCLLWTSFAAFGLGVDAVSGGPGSTAPTNGFGVPYFCLAAPPPSISIADVAVGEGAGNAVLTLSLSAPRPYPVQVTYSTADNAAKATTGAVTYSNAAAISIPVLGFAQPYPSVVSVPAVPGAVTGVTVTLNGFTHTFLNDLEVLLVGPAGQRVMLMSRIPFATGYTGNLTFSDAGLPFPDGLSAGLVRPTGSGWTGSIPAPAPARPYASALSSLAGTNVVGPWSLYVYDWFNGDFGAVNGGWSITFTTGDFIPSSGRATFSPGSTTVPISIPVVNDATGEPAETFFVNLTGAANATIADAQAVVTIVDDDGGPRVPPNPLGDAVIDFGAAGLWALHNPAGGGQWAGIHGLNPKVITGANLDGNDTRDLAVVFPGFGLYLLMNSTTWVPLHGFEPTQIEAGDLDGNGIDDLIVNFPGAGLWMWQNNTSWVQVHPFNPASIAVANIDGDAQNRADLVCGFSNVGLWVFKNNATWAPLHSADVGKLRTGDLDGNGKADVVADMGVLGLWVYFNDSAWKPLLSASAASIAIGNVDGDVLGKEDVVVSFQGYGTWIWLNNSTWVQIHDITASVIATGSLDGNGLADVLLVLPGHGVFAFMNNTGYVGIHAQDAEAFAIGRFDGR